MADKNDKTDADEQLGSNLPQLDHDNNGEAGGSLPASQRPRDPKKVAKGLQERTWIQLEENDEIPPTGLYVGHNGNGFLIRAGEPVNVPNYILEILDHSVQTMPVTDPTTRRVIGHRERMRFPYRRVEAPAQPE